MSEEFQCEFDDAVVLEEIEKVSKRMAVLEQGMNRALKILEAMAKANRIQIQF
jgi:hypothetical protein